MDSIVVARLRRFPKGVPKGILGGCFRWLFHFTLCEKPFDMPLDLHPHFLFPLVKRTERSLRVRPATLRTKVFVANAAVAVMSRLNFFWLVAHLLAVSRMLRVCSTQS